MIREGDNRYHLKADLEIARGGELPILVRISQRIVGEIISVQLRHVILVVPGSDLEIASETLAPGWAMEGDNTVRLEGFKDSVPAYEGKALVGTASDVGFRGWGVTFTPDTPVSPIGYRSLRFAFHPGTLTARAPFLNLRLAPAANINLLDGHIDLSRAEWQTVELHFEDMEVGSSQNSVLITKQGLDEPIESIHLQGSLEGTFFLDVMHLVSLVQDPPVTAVDEESTSMPDRFALEQSFPNPFNSSTTLRFSLPAPSPVELSIYNLSGQRVVTLMHEIRDQGPHQIRWDGIDAAGRDVATGIYIYRLATGSHVQTRKLLLLR